jgi:hypothetical protein
MKNILRFLLVAFLSTFLIPGYALADVLLDLSHPATVLVGQTFDVTLTLEVTGPTPPASVCSYQYCLKYDHSLVTLLHDTDCQTSPPADSKCIDNPDPLLPDYCVIPPPIDGGYFTRTCGGGGSDNCTAAGFPMVNPFPGPFPGTIQYNDLAGLNSDGAYGCPPEHVIPRTHLVSTLTFTADSPGCFYITPSANCRSYVQSCDFADDTQYGMTITDPFPHDDNSSSQICVRQGGRVPASSGPWTVILALVIAGSSILIIKRYRGTRRS